jgi:heptosyltransferase I
MNLASKRILIVKPSSLGDVVHTLPLAHAIKRTYPSCHIGWIVQQSFRAILENDPAVDEIISISIPSTSDPHASRGAWMRAAKATFEAVRRMRTHCRREPYDLVLDLHASFRSGVLALMNPGGLRIGFADAKELNTLFQHERIRPTPAHTHAVDKNLAFADRLGCVVLPEDFRVYTAAAAREKVRSFLQDAGSPEPNRLVYANPAARWETKFWTVDAWPRLADLLIEQAGATVVFSGSPADEPYISMIRKQMKNEPLIAAGKLSLSEAVALIEASDVYVGVDSGPMHIAAFTGTRIVALFGPTDPAKVGPYGQGHTVIRRTELDCLACRKRSCADRQCLEGITPQTVFDETVRLMRWDKENPL